MTIENDAQHQAAINRIAQIHQLTNNRPHGHPLYGHELNALARATTAYSEAKYKALGNILYRLRKEQVFSVEIHENEVLFMEECDNAYCLSLTKPELLELIRELQAIADRLA